MFEAISFLCSVEEKKSIADAAKKSDKSMAKFCKQAVLKYIEGKR